MISTAVVLAANLAASALSAQTQQLTLDGSPRGLHALDATGDGVLDGVVVLSAGTGRSLVVVDGAQLGALPTAAPRPFAAPADAVLFGVCPGLGPGLLFLRPGALERRAPDGRVVVVAALQGGLPLVESGDLAAVELCPDGQPPVIVPSLAGALVIDAAGVARPLDVPTRTHMASGLVFRGPRARRDFSLMTVLVHPRAFAGDVGGDGGRDLGFAVEEELALYAGGAPAVRLRLPLRSAAQQQADEGIVDTHLCDLTGDRVLDAVVTWQRGGSDSLRTSWQVLAGPLLGKRTGTTLASVERQGLAAPLLLHDVDLDGVVDLVEPRVDTGILAMGKALVTGRIPVRYTLHRFAGGRHVESLSLDLDAAVDFSRSTQMAGHPPLLGLDLDDDGRGDWVDLGERERVAVHLGRARAPLWTEEPGLEVDVPSTERAISLRQGRAGPPVLLFLDERDGRARLTLVRFSNSVTDAVDERRLSR